MSRATSAPAGIIPDGRRTALCCVALGAANSTFILAVTGLLSGRLGHEFAGDGAGPTAFTVLTLVRVTLLIIALVVSAVVTANAYAVVASGQARVIALRRLLGAPAAAERRRLAGQAMRQAVPVSLLAAVGSGLLCLPLVNALLAAGRTAGVSLAGLAGCLPAVGLGLLAHLASVRWSVARGYAPVLARGPVVALRVADDPEHLAPVARSRAVPGWARVGGGLAAGMALLALLAALVTPYAVLPGLAAGALAAVAVIGSAERIVSVLVGALTRFATPGGDLDIAARRLRQHPARTARASLAVAIGVCVVTMLAVASATGLATVDGYLTAASRTAQQIDGIVLAGAVLVSLTAVTSALGVVITISHGLRLRHREIALLRVLGQTPRRTRRMIRAEAALLSASAVLLGLACGVGYGWFGAQLLLGRPTHRLAVIPVVPLPVLLAALVAAGGLTWISTAWPARQVLRRPPIRGYLGA